MGLESGGAPPNGGEFGTRRNWPAIAQKLERSLAVRRPPPSPSLSLSLCLFLSLLPFFPTNFWSFRLTRASWMHFGTVSVFLSAANGQIYPL